MPNTIGSPDPNKIDLREEAGMWQYPTTPELDENPAAQARAEHLQHEYVEALARDDYVSTPEFAAGPVNDFETVPATGEIAGYATNTGNAIDPSHSEAVVAAAQASVADAFAADPDMLAMVRANEEQRINRERHAEALRRADAYAPRLEDMRDRALLDWGADAA